MDSSDQQHRRIRELEERLSRLSQASLRITEDLEFNSVLQGALDSARSLTGARYGVITLHGDNGTAADFLSSGMTTEETDQLWNLLGWPSHFQHLSVFPEPLRIPDLLGHIRSLGLPELMPPMPVSDQVSFLAFPIRHRGERVGSIFLAEKEHGREFTQEDEETLGSSPPRRPWPSPTHADTGRNSAPAPTWRRWWTLPRWAWWSSTPPRGSPSP